MTELRQIIELINNLDGINRLDAEINGWVIEISEEDWRDRRVIAFERPLKYEAETLDDIPRWGGD